MLKTVYGSTKSARLYVFRTSIKFCHDALLATLYRSEIGPSSAGSAATASFHAFLLITCIDLAYFAFREDAIGNGKYLRTYAFWPRKWRVENRKIRDLSYGDPTQNLKQL